MSEKQRLLGSVQQYSAYGDSPATGDAATTAGSAKPSFLRPLFYTLICALGPLSFGFTMGYTSPFDFTKSRHDGGYDFSSSQNSLFGSMVTVGAMAGALLGGVLLDLIGRTYTMFVAMFPFTGGFLLIMFTSGFPMMLGGRILTGVGVGLVSLAVPVYVAEIAPANLRGGLGVINQLAITIGVVLAFAIGLTGLTWRYSALIGAIPPAVLGIIALVFLPPTPRSLLKRGKDEAALRSLKRLRGEAYDSHSELQEIAAVVEAESSLARASLLDLVRGAAGSAMIIGVGLMMFQQFSGINAVIFYTGSIFDDAGFKQKNLAALIVGAVQVVVTGASSFVIDTFGRRSLLMMAGIGMTASCAVLGYFFYMKNHHEAVPGIVALISAILYIAFFSLGLGAIPWLMMSEVFPVRVRGIASSVATMLNWTFAFIVTESFDSLKAAFTEAGAFWFFGAVCICGVAFVLLKVPETKGRSLEELERFFGGDKNAGNQHVDGAGTGGATVKIATIFALIYVGVVLLTT